MARSVPRWVYAADLVALVLLGAAFWLALFGGGRYELLGVNFTARSLWRPLILSIALLALRHALVQEPTIVRRVADGWTRATSRIEVAAAAWAFLATRPAVLLVGFLAVTAVGFPVTPGFTMSPDPFINLPARYDAGWYAGVIVDGYDHRFRPGEQQNLAFFPAYPLIVRPVGAALGMYKPGRPAEYRVVRALWAGVAISLAAFFWGLVYVGRLARELIGEERAAAAVWLLAAYPFAVFYGAPYTESLFLLCSAAALYHFRMSAFAAAGLWGLLAGLTRPNGFLLALPLALFAAESAWRAWSEGTLRRHRVVAGAVAAVMPVVGMLAFTLYLRQRTGVWFAWVRTHEAWGRTPGVDPFFRLGDHVQAEGLLAVMAAHPVDALNALGVLFALVMVWFVWRKLGAVWALFVAATLAGPLLAGGLMSMGRITATLFPLFLALAAVLPRGLVAPCAAGFAVVQGLAAVLFYTWRELI